MGFDFIIKYKQGKTNTAIDSLSRVPHTGNLFAITLLEPFWWLAIKDENVVHLELQKL